MKEYFDANLKASFQLWLDDILCRDGEAFKTETSNLVKLSSKLSGFSVFKAPKNQFVYDDSIPSATVPRGAILNGVSTTSSGVGTISNSSNFIIDYLNGRILTKNSLGISTASMTYSYKEIETRFTSLAEHRLIFHDKVDGNTVDFSSPETTEKQVSYPIIYIKYSPGTNTPFCFGGTDKTASSFRLVFLADSSWLFDNVCGLLRDQERKMIGYVSSDKLPFNALGDLKYTLSGNHTFSYRAHLIDCLQNNTNLCEISSVKISPFTEEVNTLIDQKLIGGFIDIGVSALRTPRL